MFRTLTLCAALLVPLASCGGGGGGGGTPLRNPPKVLLADVELPPGAASGALELGLAAEQESPTMMQVDIVTDPGRIRLAADVEAIADVGDLDAGLIEPGRLRIVFGDATTKSSPRKLPLGALVRIPFAVVAGTAPAVVEVRAEQPIASDDDGEATDVEQAPVVAQITLR